MANMIRCTLASGGGALVLTVTCDADFAGLTITATDGTTTLTQTCPSTSPYEVEFKIPNAGQWIISGVISGDTQSLTVDIPDNVTLHYIPNGSTVTPTDDIQTWLHCSNIWDKSYTTISEVLNDAITVTALIASNNAADYMARSTTWASDVCADSSAMTKIGANDYCADTLLADSTWLNAICNSTYFENVLNVKVPTLTSNNGCSANNYYTQNPPYKAFNGNNSDYWSTNDVKPGWIQYDFGSAKKIYCVAILPAWDGSLSSCRNFVVQGSNDNYVSDTHDLYSGNSSSTNIQKYNFIPNDAYRYLRLYISTSDQRWVGLKTLQFYGRA